MKVLYAIQGTGNGHLARATEIVPILKTMAETDVLVSGTQSDLKVPFPIDYRFSGLSFIFGKNGGVDIWDTARKMQFFRFLRDVKNLPVDRYNLVISDFEPVSAWACKLRRKECIGLSHQNAVLHPSAPKPEFSDWFGKFILKRYAPAAHRYGFNFKPSPPDIFPPVIRPAIRSAVTEVNPHYTVYLPAYSDQQIVYELSKIPDIEWQVFSKHSKQQYTTGKIWVRPVSLDEFTHSFITCKGLICTAGFEGPAEAIFMGKKLCVVPMKNQYEQYCNAAYLKSLGIKVLENFSGASTELVDWMEHVPVVQEEYPDLTHEILSEVLKRHNYC
jgi:uncharacterized protein (TIGR00661 family)